MIVPLFFLVLAQDPAETGGTAPADLMLECRGSGGILTSGLTLGRVGDDNFTAQTVERENNSEIVRIEFENGAGRIFVPRRMRPPLRGGGDEGWWPLTDLDVQPERIEARYQVNFINRPKVVLNRQTGDIDIGGTGIAYSGVCSVMEERPEVLF